MSNFLIRRLISSIPVLFGILLVTFVLNRSIPGDPCRAVLGERATDAVCDAYMERYGLNEPITVQFVYYLRNVLQGDLGTSLRFGRTVVELLAERLPVTIELAFSALIFAILAGIPLGIISAYRRNSAVDVGTMLFANIGVSMPVFWLGLMMAFFFGVILKDTPLALPPSGRLTAGSNPTPFFVMWGWVEDPDQASNFLLFLSRFNILNAILTLNGDLLLDAARHLLLPALAVGTIPLAITARMTRSSLLEALGQDYTRTARAKGLRETTVVIGHAVRNSLLPVVTIIGLSFGGLVSGAVLTETIFGFSGIGRTLVDGITSRDYTLVQGVTLVTAVTFVIINLLVDILYGYLDPRIRLS
ncbi:MAG: ABC transporter permease [Anaerolineae bacterium]|nr:ABC transporter permease [Anaerolineae bacterium]